MGVLLVCDCATENCFQTALPVVENGRPMPPAEWRMTDGGDGRMLVACCSSHYEIIMQNRGTKR